MLSEFVIVSKSWEIIIIIFPSLIEEKLFLVTDLERYQVKIATGSMKEEDWLLAIEKAIDKTNIGTGE